jgi:hypothetical protein
VIGLSFQEVHALVRGYRLDRGARRGGRAARAKAICEAEAQDLEDERIATEHVLINAIHDTAGDVPDALVAFNEATPGDPDEVADLVDEPGSADDIEREARFKLAILDAAAAVRVTVNEALTWMGAALRRQGVDRDEVEQSIRELAFGDES